MNDHPEPETYEIRLRGRLDTRWANRLDVPSLSHQPDGTTLLRGIAEDQAALHGLLQRIRDLGLTLVSVVRIGPAPQINRTEESDMKITNPGLLRWGGMAALVAGLSYALVGALHPPNELAAVTGAPWLIVHILAMATSIFGLFGLAALHARQAEKSGWVGLAGYLLLSLWLLLILGFTFVEVLVLPALAATSPAFAAGWLGMFNGAAAEPAFAALSALWTLTGPLYILGGLLFGIATFRARILSRWAGLLLAAGTLLGPLAALLPLDLQPKVAIPVGLALAWLGYSSWSERRGRATASSAAQAVSAA